MEARIKSGHDSGEKPGSKTAPPRGPSKFDLPRGQTVEGLGGAVGGAEVVGAVRCFVFLQGKCYKSAVLK